MRRDVMLVMADQELIGGLHGVSLSDLSRRARLNIEKMYRMLKRNPWKPGIYGIVLDGLSGALSQVPVTEDLA